MNSKRLYYVLIGLIALALFGLVGGAYQANSLLAQKATGLTALKAKNLALAQEQQSLVGSRKEIAKYATLEKITRAVVPEDKNQAEAVGEIVKIAAANGVRLASVTFPASTLGNVSASKAPTPTGASSSTKPTKSLSQVLPVKNIPGVYLLVIAVQGDPQQSVPYDRFIAFLSDLEHNRRTAQVSAITLTPDAENRNNLTFNLSLNEYIKP